MKATVIMHSAKILTDMRRIEKKVPDASNMAMSRACEMLRGYIVSKKLRGQVLKRKTGDLARRLTKEVAREGHFVVGRVGTNLKYARIHELGGTIRPVRAKYLCFKVDGQFVKVKKVIIPKRPYIAPSMKEYRPQLQKILGQTFWTEVTSG